MTLPLLQSQTNTLIEIRDSLKRELSHMMAYSDLPALRAKGVQIGRVEDMIDQMLELSSNMISDQWASKHQNPLVKNMFKPIKTTNLARFRREMGR